MSCDEDVDLQSWGWTDLSSYSPAVSDSEREQQIESFLLTGIMSRRSLRLDEGLLDRSVPHSSASLSVGGASWRSTRSVKPRRSQKLSLSCSESLLASTPRKLNSPSLLNSSIHSVASDASLLSSMLEDSSVQESTLVDTLWGLDEDIDPKESTVLAEQSSVLADRTLTGSDGHCPKHQVQTRSRVYCKDCEHSDRKESTNCPSSKHTSSSSSLTRWRPSEPREPETSTIYSRERSRKTQTAGVLASVWSRSAACVLSLLTVLCHQLEKHHNVTDVLQLWLNFCLLSVRRAAACCVSVLLHTWQVCQKLTSKFLQVNRQTDNRPAAQSSQCGVMSLRETSADQKELPANGSLCDVCKDKRRSETDTIVTSSSSSSSWSSLASCLLGLMWSAAVFTGETAGGVYRSLSRQWHHMTTSVFLTQFPLRLLLILPLLLLIFSLCWFGLAGLQSALPVVNITEWTTFVSDVPYLSSIYDFVSPHGRSAEGAVVELGEVQSYEELLYSRPPPAETATGEEEVTAVDESVRLLRLEQSLTALWERVEAGGQQAEQRHMEVLQLYTDLQQQQQQVSAQSRGEEPWLSGLLDPQLEKLRTQLDQERQQREQTRQQDLSQQQSQTSRLDQLQLQLQVLAVRTEEALQRQQAAETVSTSSQTHSAAVRVGVDRQSHDALLAEVARLEAALEDIRRDVEGLSRCRGLERMQQTILEQVSSQVREEVRTLVYGSQLTVRGGASGDTANLPESLLQWLSQQYVSGADLQASLASLELSILQNISLQLKQRRSEEAATEAVLQAAGEAGATVTEEDVHVIVQNALRLFSQDRTGLPDFALESGGGSILSTRCSETYETKAALLSLFGVPLWYFSQSPRAAIQPDVHPGNCWAFRGSTGFLVVRLSMRIVPTAFTMEHIPKALAPSGALRSAPRDFSVYGLDDESQERGKLLGTFTYDEDGEALQTFTVTEESERSFQIIEVKVLSNWGHAEYTCMYRFRVHGTPRDV